MTARIAINGYGRIGRCILRALYEGRHRGAVQQARPMALPGQAISGKAAAVSSVNANSSMVFFGWEPVGVPIRRLACEHTDFKAGLRQSESQVGGYLGRPGNFGVEVLG